MKKGNFAEDNCPIEYESVRIAAWYQGEISPRSNLLIYHGADYLSRPIIYILSDTFIHIRSLAHAFIYGRHYHGGARDVNNISILCAQLWVLSGVALLNRKFRSARRTHTRTAALHFAFYSARASRHYFQPERAHTARAQICEIAPL